MVVARSRFSTDERRQQLLDLGVELFSNRSYDEISIDEIAKKANISKGLLYHYFPSKKVFYVETIRVAAAQFLDAVEPPEDVEEPMRSWAAMQAYLDYVEAHADAYVALYQSGVGIDPEISNILEQTRATIVNRIIEGIGLPEPRPHFRSAISSWIGAVESACLDWLKYQDVVRTELVAMLLGQLVLAIRFADHLDKGAELDYQKHPTLHPDFDLKLLFEANLD